MKLGLTLGYSGAVPRVNLELVQEAERLGYDIVWSAEAYGSDAIVPLAWIGAHTSRIRLGTKHDRKVALKVLRPELADDRLPSRLRFDP